MPISWNQIEQQLQKAQVQLEPSAHLVLDSRNVKTGDVFVATKGLSQDGANYVTTALEAGADAVLVSSRCDASLYSAAENVLKIDDLELHLAEISRGFYQVNEHTCLPVVGITGTNGKTSVSHLLAQLSEQANKNPTAVVGTMGNGDIRQLQATNNTTPGITEVYRLLSQFKQLQYQAVAMEVSSHALEQGRIKGVPVHTAIFTNLTLDHLDYHGTMEAYFAAKAKLFTDYQASYSVINFDDEYGKQLIGLLPEQQQVVVYGFDQQVQAYSDYVWVKQLDCHPFGTSIEIEWQFNGAKEVCELQLPLYGAFNGGNLAAVFATALTLNWPLQATQFSMLKPVPGRLELFVKPNKPVVIVDYAHTPDALEQSLIAVKQHLTGKLLVIFGCGGDRDKSKRPVMAGIAEQYADTVIVTNDNPRTESPESIVADIQQGFESSEHAVIYDRKQAIEHALSIAAEGDAILVAGKGHETYQVIGKDIVAYDERKFVKALLCGEVSK